jgi:ABC-type glycerol-3-phosphate transport system substrate-binding protein
MNRSIDKNSRVPLYLQVKEYILDLIQHELRGITTKLPPEMEISRHFGISRATVRTAILDLVKDGVLERVPGKGTFISEISNTLRFTSWNLLEKPMSESLRTILEWFSKEHYGASIKPIGIPYEKTEYQLMAMALSGRAPDVATLIYFWIPVFAHHGALHPLDDLYTDDVTDNLYPQTLANVRFNDHYYGFNWINAPNILYYNREILEEYLGTSNTMPETYDEFLEYSIRIHEKSRGSLIPFSIPILEDEIFFLLSVYNFLLAFEGGVISSEGEIILNSEANIKAFQWLKKFIKTGRINTTQSFRDNRRLFSNNKLAFIIDGPWLKSIIPSLYSKNPLSMEGVGFATLPKGPKNIAYSLLWNHTLSIFKQCKNRELALEFIRYLALNRKNVELYYRETGMFPVMADEIKENAVYNDNFGRVLKKQMETALPVPAQHPSFLLSVTFCAKAAREILLGGADIKSTLNSHTEIIKELFK